MLYAKVGDDVKIENLKYFLSVVKTGSLHKTAEMYYLTPQNLSTIIRNIEQDAGEVLFSRTAKGMVLTAEGERFLPYAQSMYNTYEEYFKGKKPENNILTLYTTPAIANDLAELQGALLEKHYYLSIQKRSITDLQALMEQKTPGFYLLSLREDHMHKLGNGAYAVLLEYNKSIKVVHCDNPVLHNRALLEDMMVIMQDHYEGNYGDFLRIDNVDTVKDFLIQKHAVYSCIEYQYEKNFKEKSVWVILEEDAIPTFKHCLIHYGEYPNWICEDLERQLKDIFQCGKTTK